MNDRCPEYREKLEDMISRDLPPDDRDTLEQHLVVCADCRRYRRALEEDDRLLGSFSASMEGLASRIEDGVMRAPAAGGPAALQPPRKFRLVGNPVSRVAAAVVVVAAIVLISSLFDSSPRRDIVWADVFERIENPPNYISKSQIFHDGQFVHESVIYYSHDLGFRRDIYKKGALTSRKIFNFEKRTTSSLYYPGRVCRRDSLGSQSTEQIRKTRVLNRIDRLKERKHVSLGLSEIDGITVSGIEIVDTLRGESGTKVGKIRIYVDVDTQWPALIEYEGVTVGRMTRSEYQWQPQLTRGDFEPDIPADFFVADLDLPIELHVERAITGLRNFSRITGRYPEDLDIDSLRREVAAERDKLEQAGSYSPDIADSMNTVLNANILCRWQDDFPKRYEPGEFKYYDSSVTPSDTRKVLYRWRIGDKVGVIYGDLRYGTADAEQFEEFDKGRYPLEDDENL